MVMIFRLFICLLILPVFAAEKKRYDVDEIFTQVFNGVKKKFPEKKDGVLKAEIAKELSSAIADGYIAYFYLEQFLADVEKDVKLQGEFAHNLKILDQNIKSLLQLSFVIKTKDFLYGSQLITDKDIVQVQGLIIANKASQELQPWVNVLEKKVQLVDASFESVTSKELFVDNFLKIMKKPFWFYLSFISPETNNPFYFLLTIKENIESLQKKYGTKWKSQFVRFDTPENLAKVKQLLGSFNVDEEDRFFKDFAQYLVDKKSKVSENTKLSFSNFSGYAGFKKELLRLYGELKKVQRGMFKDAVSKAQKQEQQQKREPYKKAMTPDWFNKNIKVDDKSFVKSIDKNRVVIEDPKNNMEITLILPIENLEQVDSVPFIMYHKRVKDWFANPEQVLYSLNLLPKDKKLTDLSDKEKVDLTTTIKRHAFAQMVDPFIMLYGQQSSYEKEGKKIENKTLAGQIKIIHPLSKSAKKKPKGSRPKAKEETLMGVFGYAQDPKTGEWYHRFFATKNPQEIAQEYIEKAKWELDFPPLSKE